MQAQISQGTIDSPSWDIIRSAKTATKIYAPIGTNMSLGDYVRICRSFVEVFKWAQLESNGNGGTTSGSEEEDAEVVKSRYELVNALKRDLKVRDTRAKISNEYSFVVYVRNIRMTFPISGSRMIEFEYHYPAGLSSIASSFAVFGRHCW